MIRACSWISLLSFAAARPWIHGGGACQTPFDCEQACLGLDRPLPPGRLERYLVVAWDSETEPVVKGQTAASSNKPAILENGVRIMVPPFIEAGDQIVVDTNEVTYIKRAD